MFKIFSKRQKGALRIITGNNSEELVQNCSKKKNGLQTYIMKQLNIVNMYT